MANIKSQKKRILTNEKARVRNRDVKTALKTYIKGFHETVKGEDDAAVVEALRTATRQLDRAASKGVIHPKNAANRKSALARAYNTSRTPS